MQRAGEPLCSLRLWTNLEASGCQEAVFGGAHFSDRRLADLTLDFTCTDLSLPLSLSFTHSFALSFFGTSAQLAALWGWSVCGTAFPPLGCLFSGYFSVRRWKEFGVLIFTQSILRFTGDPVEVISVILWTSTKPAQTATRECQHQNWDNQCPELYINLK